mmetsp:Transcript_39217/g.92330  ORF Transcript_39217/g.92330 Transcript_39217/m.92330 type:complete len:188 (-) Transcript_39217:182-745(-)
MMRTTLLLAFFLGAVSSNSPPPVSVLQLGAEIVHHPVHIHEHKHQHRVVNKDKDFQSPGPAHVNPPTPHESSLLEKRVKQKMEESGPHSAAGKRPGAMLAAVHGEDRVAEGLSESMTDAMASSLSAVYNAEEQAHQLKEHAAHDLKLADELLKNVSTLSAGLQDAMAQSIKNLQRIESESADDDSFA